LTAKYFIPIFGSFYHFMMESMLGLYHELERADALKSRDCRVWYQGSYTKIVSFFSVNPIVTIPISKPYLKDARAFGPDIKQISHPIIKDFNELVPFAKFISDLIPIKKTDRGITLIKRTNRRVYEETDELFGKLKTFDMPVRCVQLEYLPFEEQVNIFRSTRLLIAPHGAGTVNQMFMPAGGSIIEIFPMGDGNWQAKKIADAFGHELITLNADKPGILRSNLSKEVKDWFAIHGWPDRKTVEFLDSRSYKGINAQICRAVRNCQSYSVNPDKIMEIAQRLLTR
jgi:hypothetical protein